MSDLLLVFLIGVLGSAHCVGMCGGFVVALGAAQRGGRSVHVRQTLYFLGKTATYAVFGLLAGTAGAAAGLALAGFQGILSIGLGLVLVGIGLGLCGAFRRLALTDQLAARVSGARALGKAVRTLVARGTPGATFGLGALNGLIPCGLVYALLVQAAATSSALSGAAVMATFGLATVPALYLTGLVGNWLPPARRVWLTRAGGVLVVVLGLLTLSRGTMALDLLAHSPAATTAEQLICNP